MPDDTTRLTAAREFLRLAEEHRDLGARIQRAAPLTGFEQGMNIAVFLRSLGARMDELAGPCRDLVHDAERGLAVRPEHDCPPCAKCGRALAVGAGQCGFHPPEGHTLYCPRCGHTWVGSPEHVEQARKADAAWAALEGAK